MLHAIKSILNVVEVLIIGNERIDKQKMKTLSFVVCLFRMWLN